MNNYNQQAYYNQHYNILDQDVWQGWKPESNLLQKKNLSEFTENFWEGNSHECILANIAKFAPFHSVLDIGCGTGEFLIPLSQASKSSYGVDIVEFSLAWQFLKSEYGITCQHLNLDYAGLPFEDASFDLVTMMMVLEHVFNVHHAVQEISRVLQVNGIVVLQVPNIAYIKHRIALLMGKLPCTANIQNLNNHTEWDGQHLHYFTLETLANLLNQYGLQVIKVKTSGKLAQLRGLWTSLLGADLIVFARKT